LFRTVCEQAVWLGKRAYIRVLQRHKALYWPVVRALEREQTGKDPNLEMEMELQRQIPDVMNMLGKCEEVLDTAQW
jgi:hypothetical protein